MKRDIRDRMEYRNCTFKPELNRNSERMMSMRRQPETQSALIKRLAVTEAVQRDIRRKKLEDAYYSSNPAIPSIDPRSSAIALSKQGHSPDQVHTRLYSARYPPKSMERGKENEIPTNEMVSPPSKKRARSAHTGMRNRYSHVQGKLSNPERILEYMDQARRIKNERIQMRYQELEEREMEECTFQPNCQKRLSDTVSLIPISGLERFLEARRKARQLNAEKASLGESYISLRSDGGHTHSGLLTVPVPFNFTPVH